MSGQKKYNFGAGPSAMPESVLSKCSKVVISFNDDTKESILEISHRSQSFKKVIDQVTSNLKQLLEIPDSHTILLLQGGGTGQFASSVLNVLASYSDQNTPRIGDYLISGNWSKASYEEAKKLGINVNIIADAKENSSNFNGIPDPSTFRHTPKEKCGYTYYCANETVNGVEVFDPSILYRPDVPLICDMSSNIMARTIDVSKFAVIFAGAQKNLGPSGITLVIVRKDLLNRVELPKHPIPSVFDYTIMDKHQSLYNTPPTFAILALGYTLEWVLAQGGLKAMHTRGKEMAHKVYSVIDGSNGFYNCPVKSKDRSLTNIVFTLPTPELEKQFVDLALAKDMINLKGHRSVGGIRVSLYNGLPDQAVSVLTEFMSHFVQNH